jgi:hypothetical protein
MGIIDALEVDGAVEEGMTKSIEIILNNMLTPLKEKTVEAIWTWGTIGGQRFDDIINLLICERGGEWVQPIHPINEIFKTEVHDGFISVAQALGESVPNYSSFGIMVTVGNAVIGDERGDFISPVGLSGSSVEEFGAPPSKFDPPYSASILPVDSPVM